MIVHPSFYESFHPLAPMILFNPSRGLRNAFRIATLFAVCLAIRSNAQATLIRSDGPRLYLRSITLSPTPIGDDPSGALAFLKPGQQTAILQFAGPIREEWKNQAESAGIRLLHYLPDFGFVAKGSGSAFLAASKWPFVRWIGPYQPEWRLSPALPGTGDISALVDVDPNASLSSFIQFAESKGLKAAVSGSHLIRVQGSAEAIRTLSESDDALWIAPPAKVRLLNDRSRTIIGANSVWSDLGLYGEGQILAIVDTGLDSGSLTTLSTDFQGRVLQGVSLVDGTGWFDNHGHGTHVAGAMVGQGNPASDPPDPNSFAGVAPRASLVVQAYRYDSSTGLASGLPDDLDSLYQQAYDLGARVHNDSWGDTYTPYGDYSIHCEQVDDFIWKHPDLSIVFAAGNDGTDSPTHADTPENATQAKLNGTGVIQPDSLFAPATAKNCIAVGASEGNRPPNEGWGGYSNNKWSGWGFQTPPISTDYVSDHPEGVTAFSSRGPTTDGRIKPDLLAPGSDIVSTLSRYGSGSNMWGAYKVSGYAMNGGSSIAAGFESGAGGLIRQWSQKRGDDDPSAALVKAILLNGAKDLYPGQYGTGQYQEVPHRPNIAEGWGRLDVGTAIDPLTPLANRFEDAKVGLNTGGSRSWLFKAKSAGNPMRIMLVWSDYPGSPDASISLVNDLNLTVEAPDGSELLGNGSQDKANNVEAVNLDSAMTGEYRINVAGYNVPQGPQPFAIDVLGAIGDLVVPGDVDGDGKLTVRDVTMALQAAVGLLQLSDDATLAGDVVRKGASAGKVDLLDVTALLRAAVGLQTL